MLSGKRATRVGDQILRFIAELLIERIRDPRVSKVKLTDISLSNDLKNAFVYFERGSVNEKELNTSIRKAIPFLKKKIGQNTDLRYVPNLHFEFDAYSESVSRVMHLLDGIGE